MSPQPEAKLCSLTALDLLWNLTSWLFQPRRIGRTGPSLELLDLPTASGYLKTHGVWLLVGDITLEWWRQRPHPLGFLCGLLREEEMVIDQTSEFMKMGRSEYSLKPEAQKEPTQVTQNTAERREKGSRFISPKGSPGLVLVLENKNVISENLKRYKGTGTLLRDRVF